MSSKRVVGQFTTPSSSSAGKVHTTLIYEDGSTSCNCMGWTRRLTSDGRRSCKHTRIAAERQLWSGVRALAETGSKPFAKAGAPPPITAPKPNNKAAVSVAQRLPEPVETRGSTYRPTKGRFLELE
jgi:hypothetical protein